MYVWCSISYYVTLCISVQYVHVLCTVCLALYNSNKEDLAIGQVK